MILQIYRIRRTTTIDDNLNTLVKLTAWYKERRWGGTEIFREIWGVAQREHLSKQWGVTGFIQDCMNSYFVVSHMFSTIQYILRTGVNSSLVWDKDSS